MHAPGLHHRRFYIFMTTIVVGAILVLMVINDDGQFDILTSASVGIDSLEDVVQFDEDTGTYLVKDNEITLRIETSTIPVTDGGKVAVQTLTINSRDINNKIRINNEVLEVQNLEEITLALEGFVGDVSFDDFILTLSGEVNRASVNGVGISTAGRLAISFDRLSYDSLNVEGIRLPTATLYATDGKLIIPDKLDYGLAGDDVHLTDFLGNFNIGSGEESFVVLDGQVKGVSVAGGLIMEVK
ncbi:MAG: hypothetical protein CMH61_00070 [Nanoarchaeota archaeon]|nr:hypothetical protein [Nanoarchaeota archaeon]